MELSTVVSSVLQLAGKTGNATGFFKATALELVAKFALIASTRTPFHFARYGPCDRPQARDLLAQSTQDTEMTTNPDRWCSRAHDHLLMNCPGPVRVADDASAAPYLKTCTTSRTTDSADC